MYYEISDLSSSPEIPKFLEFKIPIVFMNLGDFQLWTCNGYVTIIREEVPLGLNNGMNYRSSITCAKCIKWEPACVNLGCEVHV